jgi:hypothetical protein
MGSALLRGESQRTPLHFRVAAMLGRSVSAPRAGLRLLLWCLLLGSQAVVAAPPTAGGSAGAAASGGGAAASGGGVGQFQPGTMLFFKSGDSWANWSLGLKLPDEEKKQAVYLCYEIVGTDDGNAPFALKPVLRFKNDNDFKEDFPCYETNGSDRPIMRGDRLRVAIDLDTPAAKLFFKDVTLIGLNVNLAPAPPIQKTLLRFNLGTAPPAASGLGSNQAPEAGKADKNGSGGCFLQILRLEAADEGKPCTGPKGRPPSVLLLPWKFTLPGDVVASISIQTQYTTPENGGAWTARMWYPAGSVVNCPGEDLCLADPRSSGQISGIKEPAWPGPGIVQDGKQPSPILWTPINASYRTKGSYPPTPDGKPAYEVNDVIVWQSGQTTVQSTVEPWRPNQRYTANQSVIVVPADPKQGPQRLFAATTTATSGPKEPFWASPVVPDPESAASQIFWSYNPNLTEQTRKHQVGDYIVWYSKAAGELHSTVESWLPSHPYKAGTVILCPPDDLVHPVLCAAQNDGISGRRPPPSWKSPTVKDGDAAVVNWTVGINSSLDRWLAQSTYRIGAAVRCEQAAQHGNLCSNSPGGYSGTVEPWWVQQSSTTAASTTPAQPQRDNQILWTPFTATSTNAAPSSDATPTISADSLPQTHAPYLFGLSTAVIYITSRLPTSYTFSSVVAAGCANSPAAGAGSSVGTPCPKVITSSQRNADIALLISPYILHSLFSKFTDIPNGIDVESDWNL